MVYFLLRLPRPLACGLNINPAVYWQLNWIKFGYTQTYFVTTLGITQFKTAPIILKWTFKIILSNTKMYTEHNFYQRHSPNHHLLFLLIISCLLLIKTLGNINTLNAQPSTVEFQPDLHNFILLCRSFDLIAVRWPVLIFQLSVIVKPMF